MNYDEAKRIDRCGEITFALKRVSGSNSAGKDRYYATMGHSADKYTRECIDILSEERDIRDTGITPEQSKGGARHHHPGAIEAAASEWLCRLCRSNTPPPRTPRTRNGARPPPSRSFP